MFIVTYKYQSRTLTPPVRVIEGKYANEHEANNRAAYIAGFLDSAVAIARAPRCTCATYNAFFPQWHTLCDAALRHAGLEEVGSVA